MQEEPRPLSSGVFEGQYLDAYGYRGLLKIDVKTSDNRLEGNYELTIVTEDKPQVLTGRVEGTQERAAVRLRLALGKEGKEQKPLEYVAEVRPAGSHARQCMYGLVNAPKESGLGGGVWIAWEFAERRPGKQGCGNR